MDSHSVRQVVEDSLNWTSYLPMKRLFLCIHSAQLPLSRPISLPGSCLSVWERVACSLSELQPSPKWNGFKLRTFDSDSVWTLSSCGPAGPLSELEGQADPCQPWVWGKFSVCYESSRPQNKRWDHVWVGRLLKPLSDGEGSYWIKGCFVDLWCNTDWQNRPFLVEVEL